MLNRLLKDRGSSLYEYALIFPLFMAMIMGICGFGHALYAYHFVSHAAKSAARWAAVNGANCADDTNFGATAASCNGTYGMNSGPATAANISDYVKGLAPQGIDPNNLTVDTSWCKAGAGSNPATCPGSVAATSACITTANAPGCPVQVTVSYKFNFIVPLVASKDAQGNPVSLTLSDTAQMVIAH